ncbi:MAG: hypothetical protein HY040_18740 [Planctomycetes bacterium]|nr:hypothetical protein [Planctomycetota bacterium]
MKAVALVFVGGGLAFVLAGYQTGLFGTGKNGGSTSFFAKEQGKQRASFPEDLAPAARAHPVAAAADLKPDAETHRLVFLKSTGKLHDWQEYVPHEWAAERVEDTELAVVLGPQRRTFLDVFKYPNGAPPISRYKFEVEVSVVEAKTGKVIANRLFINMPRAIKQLEAWELTALGQPVSFQTVYQWVCYLCNTNFPADMNPGPPLTNVVR